MPLNHKEIQSLIDGGHVKNFDPNAINAASLDIRLGETLMFESLPLPEAEVWTTDYRVREPLHMYKIEMLPEGLHIPPRKFFLGHSMEEFNLPDNVSAILRTKSSMGRIALEHMDAGFIDPGFNGVLTLEFVNMTEYHSIQVRPGDFVGQLIFFHNEEVDPAFSYRTKGNYNGKTTVTQTGFK